MERATEDGYLSVDGDPLITLVTDGTLFGVLIVEDDGDAGLRNTSLSLFVH